MSSSSTLSSPTPGKISSKNNVLPLALGITFGIVFLLLIVIATIFALIYLVRKRHKKGRAFSEKQKTRKIEGKDEEPVLYSVIGNDIASSEYLPKNEMAVTDDSRSIFTNEHIIKEGSVEIGIQNNLSGSSSDDKILPEATETLMYSNTIPMQPAPAIADVMYHEITLASNRDIEEKNHYSKANIFNTTESMYYQDDAGYDHIRPLSFVLSDTYSNGPIYDVPKIVNSSFASIVKISQENLEEISNIGIGQFGEVVLAKTKDLSLKDLGLSDIDDKRDVRINVAVKMMKPNSDKALQVAFEKEAKFMGQLKHGNVIKLLAVNEDGCEPFMVMEYMENGDLNQFLLWHHISKSHPPNNREELSPQNLLSMVIQVASGMAYLASHNYIHRDIATRNCLVGEDNVIKIADFGLSRSLYDSVYYRVKGKAKMPIRWMATECFYGKFSQFSDVWAYGVTVWEIYTMGREPPYPTFGDLEIIDDALKGGQRHLLTKPFICPNEVYDVICASCWAADCSNRDIFSVIYSQLIQIYTELYD